MPPGPHELERLTDEELIRRAATIDPASFAVLYDRHCTAAYSLACRIVGPAAAEEIVHQAFMNLWRSASGFDASYGPLRRWLLLVVRHRSLETLRRMAAQERRRVEREGSEAAQRAQAGAQPLPAVRAALRALPAEQREVLELAYFAGRSQQEIAEGAGRPLAVINERLRGALDAMRRALDEKTVELGG